MILLSDWQASDTQCSPDVLLCRQMQALHREESRLLRNSTEKHVCMSLCLHSELKIDGHTVGVYCSTHMSSCVADSRAAAYMEAAH